MSRSRDLVALLLIATVACACGTSSDSDDAEGTMSESTSGSVSPDPQQSDSASAPPPTSGTPDGGSGKDSAEQAAIDDLAAKQGIAPDDIEVVRSESVTWRDGSLGCAEPGKMYTQSLIEGQRIILAAGGAEFEYHAGGTRASFLCENPTQ